MTTINSGGSDSECFDYFLPADILLRQEPGGDEDEEEDDETNEDDDEDEGETDDGYSE